MPQKMWKHTCPEGGGRVVGMGSPFCNRCGGLGEYDGWHYRMHVTTPFQTAVAPKDESGHRDSVPYDTPAIAHGVQSRKAGCPPGRCHLSHSARKVHRVPDNFRSTTALAQRSLLLRCAERSRLQNAVRPALEIRGVAIVPTKWATFSGCPRLLTETLAFKCPANRREISGPAPKSLSDNGKSCPEDRSKFCSFVAPTLLRISNSRNPAHTACQGNDGPPGPKSEKG